MDKEYIILHAIDQDQTITQRELSSKAQISLGSVNLLINKMVKEGLIKITQIPMNRVAYMLTPKGMAEKINKTSKYIKYHYNYISEMKEKVKNQLMKLSEEYDKIYIVLEGDEISEVVKMASQDIKGTEYIEGKDSSYRVLDEIKAEKWEKQVIIVLHPGSHVKTPEGREVVYLLEKL